MKSRSNRIPASSAGDSKDDEWVEEEESWTVDCVCGVNFDDGEEMVNCDECGVWVHTRCSRYVKSDKSFACDKCKNNINNNSGGNNGHIRNNDSEETEVAQLLVELPTKTLNRMDNPLPPLTAPTSSFGASAFVPTHRPFRLWTDVPIDDRVHVQGVPGGDPALFSGISSVFGPQLWKCSGYIPKKFNFRYREFPYWVEEEVPEKNSGKKVQRPTDNVVDNGAGVLFSLARDNVVSPDDDGRGSDGFVSLKKTSKLEDDDSGVLTPQTEMSKNIKPSLILFGKRKKEDLCMSEDRSGKKVARMLDKDVGDYNNKNRLQARGIDRGPTITQADTECTKGGYTTCHLPASQLPRDSGVCADAVDTQKFNLASCQDYSEKSSFDGSGVNFSSRTVTKEVNGPHKLEESSETVCGVPSVLGCDDSVGGLENEEVLIVTAATANDVKGVFSTNGVTDLHLSGEFSEDVATAGQEAMDSGSAPDSSINLATSCLEIHAKSKTELTIGDENLNVELSSICETKLSSSGASVQPREISPNITNNTISRDCNRRVENAVRRSVVVDLHKQRDDGKLPLGHCQSNHDSSVLYDSLEAKNISPVVGPSADFESQKSRATVASPRVAAGELKVTVSSVSSFSAPLATPMFKLSASENPNGVSSQNDFVDGKQNLGPESSLAGNQNISGASTVVVMDETRHEKVKKLVKVLPKSGFSSVPKSSQLKKLSHTAVVSKRTSSDSKDSMLDSSLSPAQTPIASPSAADLANVQQIESPLDVQKTTTALQSERASSVQKKVIGPVLYQRGDKFNQSVSQSSSKVNNITHNSGSSISHATLSDEELALLLHQELNSSPRVPRVPRMRHTGSLPQLTSPTAASTLMKRTSSSGGKEHGSTSRRKTKDLAKDGAHGSMDMDDEHKKLERAPTSIDNSRQDSAFASDSIRKREADSGSATALKRSNAPSRTAASGVLSSPAEGNASNYSFTQHSPKIPSDDEKGVVARCTHRTLPGLLAEIMSEGRRMTYEALCNSVLPHWPYLRKHNGERYAYSSHSQAVLDCLRNRNEWACLVDRGPKTSGGRKRRKPDAGATGVESEVNDDIRDKSSKDGCRSKAVESRHEEFPKGKRKARKRRRLALQGRGIKDVRRLQKTDESSDDEDGSFSDSSGEIMLSEDEIQGSGTSAAGHDGAANSGRTTSNT